MAFIPSHTEQLIKTLNIMKIFRKIPYRILPVAALILFMACKQAEKKVEYGKATQELIAMVDSDPELKSLLETSLEKARQRNPDRNTNPAQNLEEYYDFITWAETAMPWTLLKKEEYPEIFDNTFQSLCAFYFLIDQPLSNFFRVFFLPVQFQCNFYA